MNVLKIVVTATSLVAAMLIIACESDMPSERSFEWSGLTFRAGSEVNYFITPLDEQRAKVT